MPVGPRNKISQKIIEIHHKMKAFNHSNGTIEQFFHVVPLYKVALTSKSVDETLVCNHSNESYWAVLSCGTVYYAVQGGSNF